VFWAAWPQLPSNVLSPNNTPAEANILAKAFPQKWAFFTSNPNEEQYRVRGRAEPTPPMDRTPYSEPGNLFGLDRGSRKQFPELDRLLLQVHVDQWQFCTSDEQCRSSTKQPIEVRNHDPNPTYCGDVTVIGYTIVPWANRVLVSGSILDSRAVWLDIHCGQD